MYRELVLLVYIKHLAMGLLHTLQALQCNDPRRNPPVETGLRHVGRAGLELLTLDMEFCHIGQAGVELLASSDLPTSASQSARITGMSHHAWLYPETLTYKLKSSVNLNGLTKDGIRLRHLVPCKPTRCLSPIEETSPWLSGDAMWPGASSFAWLPPPPVNELLHAAQSEDWSAMAESLLTAPSNSWAQGLTLSPRLKCSGAITAHCSLELQGSSDPPTSASQRRGFVMLARLVSNSWTQMIYLLQPPKSLTLLPRLECNLGTLQPPPPRFKQFSCLSLPKTGFHYVGQASLELLSSSDPTASASQSAGITGMSHCARPFLVSLQCNL
ncbi:hypothetical protein AAY473_013114 [Plecturocebus cupreus]